MPSAVRLPLILAVALALPISAGAVDGAPKTAAPVAPKPAPKPTPYPTVDRVEYVLECMKNNDGSYAFLYKCSCAIDTIATKLPYEQYVEASAVARYQSMGGERAGLFRDPEEMKTLAKRYRTINEEAKRSCAVTR